MVQYENILQYETYIFISLVRFIENSYARKRECFTTSCGLVSRKFTVNPPAKSRIVDYIFQDHARISDARRLVLYEVHLSRTIMPNANTWYAFLNRVRSLWSISIIYIRLHPKVEGTQRERTSVVTSKVNYIVSGYG